MSPQEQARLARELLALHQGPRLLVLPNAWDAASARIFEEAGFPAVGTTSAGVAYALGYPDGEKAPFEEVLAAIARIVRAVRVPVTADLETGFARTPEEMAERCRAVLVTGAVGVNLEDGTGDPARPLADTEAHAAKIRAAREAAAARGIPLVLNARTDVHVDSAGPLEPNLEEAVRRCNAYRRAGADCLFVPRASGAGTIGRVARAIEGPLNVLAGPATPPVAELQRLGVARLSLGSSAMRAAMGLLRRVSRELLERGTYGALNEETIPYTEMNALMARPSEPPGPR